MATTIRTIPSVTEAKAVSDFTEAETVFVIEGGETRMYGFDAGATDTEDLPSIVAVTSGGRLKLAPRTIPIDLEADQSFIEASSSGSIALGFKYLAWRVTGASNATVDGLVYEPDTGFEMPYLPGHLYKNAVPYTISGTTVEFFVVR